MSRSKNLGMARMASHDVKIDLPTISLSILYCSRRNGMIREANSERLSINKCAKSCATGRGTRGRFPSPISACPCLGRRRRRRRRHGNHLPSGTDHHHHHRPQQYRAKFSTHQPHRVTDRGACNHQNIWGFLCGGLTVFFASHDPRRRTPQLPPTTHSSAGKWKKKRKRGLAQSCVYILRLSPCKLIIAPSAQNKNRLHHPAVPVDTRGCALSSHCAGACAFTVHRYSTVVLFYFYFF